MNIREGMVFGCMTPEEQLALGRAAQADVLIEEFKGRSWHPKIASEPLFLTSAYRIAPTPVEPFRVDPIVWQVLDKRWRWITADKDGMGPRVSNRRPEFREGGNGWYYDGQVQILLAIFAPGLIKRGTCPWEEAIAERPEGTP